MKMPRPTFDTRPAVARLDTESTASLRDMHPDLSWVWDELDELRDGTEADELQRQVDERQAKIDDAVADIEKLIADEDMSEPVQTVLERCRDMLEETDE